MIIVENKLLNQQSNYCTNVGIVSLSEQKIYFRNFYLFILIFN